MIETQVKQNISRFDSVPVSSCFHVLATHNSCQMCVAHLVKPELHLSRSGFPSYCRIAKGSYPNCFLAVGLFWTIAVSQQLVSFTGLIASPFVTCWNAWFTNAWPNSPNMPCIKLRGGLSGYWWEFKLTVTPKQTIIEPESCSVMSFLGHRT